jgi:superfamily II DNA or RNA helicase
MPKYEFTKEECKKFKKDQTKSPRNGRKLQEGKAMHVALNKQCLKISPPKVSSVKVKKVTSTQKLKPRPSSAKRSTSNFLNENSTVIDMRKYIMENRKKVPDTKIPTKKTDIWALIQQYIPPVDYDVSKTKVSKPSSSKPSSSKKSGSKLSSSKPSSSKKSGSKLSSSKPSSSKLSGSKKPNSKKSGSKPSKSQSPERVGNCIERSKLPLKQWQIEVVEFMENNDSLLVVHETGCGKTLTAIAVSQCYLDKNPKRNVIFVGPASLTSNFKKEMKAYGVKNSDKYTFYSFEKFLSEEKKQKPVDCKNTLLIIDEAHNLRNHLSGKGISVFNCSLKSDKKLLLTATPFVNNVRDFTNIINILHGDIILGPRNSKVHFSSPIKPDEQHDFFILRKYLNKKVHYKAKGCTDDFPERRNHVVEIPMDKTFYKKYENLLLNKTLFKDPGVFANGYRRAVNSLGIEQYYSAKIESSIDILKTGKSVLYTNWIDYGIKPIEEALNKNNITFELFTGKTPKSKRQQIVDRFNKNEFDVLVITKAGAEGIDLKGVRNVVIMDPTWNDAGLEQIIGRAIRYKSHSHLPEDERFVDVYNMILVTPKNAKLPSGDTILYNIIQEKVKKSKQINEILKDMSIDNPNPYPIEEEEESSGEDFGDY